MPPPRKRPRLHFIGSSSPEPDLELATARKRNDNLLKTRWEAVFQRYERDFTGVGDEIGIISGEVEVDNGHLRSMQNEKDIGPTPESPSRFDGRRMLRAMTVAPTEHSSSVPAADEILQSIETIADNALLSDYSSEDDLFDAPSGPEVEEEDYTFHSIHSQQYDHYDSGNDSPDDLFDSHPTIRSLSVDSLFALDTQDETSAIAKQESPVPDLGANVPTIVQSQRPDLTEVTIREQVRKILQEEREQETKQEEEKIEPAWRLPVRLTSRSYSHPASTSLSRVIPTDHVPTEDEAELDIDEDLSTSLWNASTRSRRSKREVAAERNLRKIRAESEDPLQEGFTSESEESGRHSADRGPSQSSPGRATIEERARLSPEASSTQPPVQPSSPELSTTHGYGTRQALRRRTLEQPMSRPNSPLQHHTAVSTVQNLSTVTVIKPERMASIEPLPSQLPGRSKRRQRSAMPTAAAIDSSDDTLHSGSNRRDHMLAPRGSSPDDLFSAAKGEAEVEQPQDTIVVNQMPQPDSASKRQSTKRDAPRTPRVCHPWEIQTHRSERLIPKPPKSSRRSTGQKSQDEPSEVSSVNKSILPDRNTLATSVEMRKVDPVLAEIERQKILKPLRGGLCIYCNASYRDLSTAGHHWDRVLTNFAANTLDDDDPHDIEFIHSVRSKIGRRTRAPKTFLRDFRLIVELHEGNGLSFQQIASSQLLITTKHASQLSKEYATYRQIPSADTTSKWAPELEKRLWATVKKADDETTMTSVRRQLVGRNVEEMSMLVLGNKLADGFLKKYRLRNDALSDQLQTYGGRRLQSSDTVEAF